MQQLHKAAALVITVLFTWMPLTVASATDPGLQFAIEPGTGDFVQFQSGPIKVGDKVHVYYDSLRVSKEGPYGNGCAAFRDLQKVAGYAMSDNSGKFVEFRFRSLDPPTNDYVKVGTFYAPACHKGSTVIQMWFTGSDGKNSPCYDSDFGKKYRFPVICK
ncbi:MAG: hypothetical protein DRR19_26345 [Candidatus Parabeggiatoa sp. nov. 1]|nr:MAG: hypothetical protein DRR19_26345 [Gammaproteobacteria bacterium]